MRNLGRIAKASQSAGGVLELTGAAPGGAPPTNATVETTVLSLRLLRVRARFAEDHSSIERKVAVAEPIPTSFTVEQSERWVLRTPAVTVEVHADPFRLDFLDSSGSPLAARPRLVGGSLTS